MGKKCGEVLEQGTATGGAADQGESLWDGAGDKAAFAGRAANVKLCSHSWKHFTAAVKGWILFLVPAHKGFSAKWQILCLLFSASLSKSSFCSAAEFLS